MSTQIVRHGLSPCGIPFRPTPPSSQRPDHYKAFRTLTIFVTISALISLCWGQDEVTTRPNTSQIVNKGADMLQTRNFPEVSIRNSEVRYLKSAYVDELYEIDVFPPKNYYKTIKKYPVVYVLDAEYNFGCVSYITQRLLKNGDIPEILVVGIAYNTSEEEYYRKRIRDCTPASNIHGHNTGGVENFILFFQNELIP